MNDLLEVALNNSQSGRPCIAVKDGKTPYRSGWNKFFAQRQTEAEVRTEFANGAHGIAEVLFPASNYIHLDFDGPHAEEALRETGLALPETARIFTRSGYFHLVFKASHLFKNSQLSRKVRLIKAGCHCEKDGKPHACGVDLLCSGYSIIPPTPGYREDPDRPLEGAVEIPDSLVELALNASREKGKTPTKTNMAGPKIGGAQTSKSIDTRSPIGAVGKIPRIRCKYIPNSPTMMLASKVKVAITEAMGRFWKAISPASSNRLPATKPKIMGIHSLGLSVLLATCER